MSYSFRYWIHWLRFNYRLLLIVLGALFFIIFLFHRHNVVVSSLLGIKTPSIYKVVFDAGSTGTRVHVFEFNFVGSSSDLVLKSIPLFAKVKGGLSDYALNPVECRSGLIELIDQTKSAVPNSHWETTEVVLLATAGLRLLPQSQAENLLKQARIVLETSSPFRVGSVDIIDGKVEAKLMYVMAQFVHNERVAIVDLGGGSVQLAYATDNNHDEIAGESVVYIDRSMPSSALYLNSWLGYGLVAFRMKALETIDVGNPHPCVPEWTPSGTEYKYGSKRVAVIPRKSSDSVEECLEVIVKALETDRDDGKCKLITMSSKGREFLSRTDSKFGQCGLSGSWLGPSEPNSIEEWKLFSYIFDLAQEEGLVGEGESEATLTASDFLRSAKKHCQKNSTKNDEIEWWKCIDLMYVSALLTHGFRLEPDFPLKVTKRLVYDNRLELEAAWPLGAAIAALKHEL